MEENIKYYTAVDHVQQGTKPFTSSPFQMRQRILRLAVFPCVFLHLVTLSLLSFNLYSMSRGT